MRYVVYIEHGLSVLGKRFADYADADSPEEAAKAVMRDMSVESAESIKVLSVIAAQDMPRLNPPRLTL